MRRIHSSFTDSRGVNHNYFFSWLDSRTQAGFTWSEARLAKAARNSWTRNLDFGTKQGSLVNGWVWECVGERIKPTDNALNGDWSSGQPDNNDGQGRDEGCLAVMNSFDGIKWNDQACNSEKLLFAEDSDSLLSFVGLRNSGGGNFGNSNNNRDFRRCWQIVIIMGTSDLLEIVIITGTSDLLEITITGTVDPLEIITTTGTPDPMETITTGTLDPMEIVTITGTPTPMETITT
ncbi:Pulmonary surfactant-associated protein D [Orchesella cincta]|uniref:Pulmonary surfactant-associated protein D n=1 Tax=Orchesella cincta TaxID=48709 RepID=A0A1D2MB14_ORCCI|nr:Pulmonary surfactant-associated protein D [Orchesella cincta]